MASLDILHFNPFNIRNKIMKIGHKKYFMAHQEFWKNISWPIKNFEKIFMAHQYMPKIFHGPHKNPLPPPPTYLMYGPLLTFPVSICYSLCGMVEKWKKFQDSVKQNLLK